MYHVSNHHHHHHCGHTSHYIPIIPCFSGLNPATSRCKSDQDQILSHEAIFNPLFCLKCLTQRIDLLEDVDEMYKHEILDQCRRERWEDGVFYKALQGFEQAKDKELAAFEGNIEELGGEQARVMDSLCDWCRKDKEQDGDDGEGLVYEIEDDCSRNPGIGRGEDGAFEEDLRLDSGDGESGNGATPGDQPSYGEDVEGLQISGIGQGAVDGGLDDRMMAMSWQSI